MEERIKERKEARKLGVKQCGREVMQKERKGVDTDGYTHTAYS